jgi:hypothetical protein
MNNIITILQQFEKPNADFIKDKECLICLETNDIEALKIVMLPCKCSNSVYHIDCIVKFLQSGQHKNFCPHCKGKYELQLEEQIQHLIPVNTNPQNQEIIGGKFTHILVVHILSNSIMNVVNVVVARDCADYNNPEELQVLMLFYFLKLFFNYCIFMYSKNNIDKIEDCLVYSYIFQTILFFFLIYTLTKIKNNDNSTVLILNNVLLSLVDLTFRIILEYKIQNRVNILG